MMQDNKIHDWHGERLPPKMGKGGRPGEEERLVWGQPTIQMGTCDKVENCIREDLQFEKNQLNPL